MQNGDIDEARIKGEKIKLLKSQCTNQHPLKKRKKRRISQRNTLSTQSNLRATFSRSTSTRILGEKLLLRIPGREREDWQGNAGG
jgi:hypothetical protein